MGKLILILFVGELILATLALRFFGFLYTVALYLVPVFFGFLILSFQNRWIWFQMQKQLASGEAPDESLMNLMAKFVASVLIVVPSLSCKVFSVFLWFPPTRFFLLKMGRVWLTTKMAQGTFRIFTPNGARHQEFYGFSSEPRFERDAKVIDIESSRLSSKRAPSDLES